MNQLMLTLPVAILEIVYRGGLRPKRGGFAIYWITTGL